MFVHKYTALISSKKVSGIDFIDDIIQTAVIAVGNDTVTHFLKFFQISDDPVPEERGPRLQSRFINDDLRSLGTDPLHNALDR